MLDLPTLKKHLNVEHDEDDAYLTLLYSAVKGMAEGYLDSELVDVAAEGKTLINDKINTALMIGVAWVYSCRGDNGKQTTTVKEHELPSGFHAMLINSRVF
jgi:hypothetical protein